MGERYDVVIYEKETRSVESVIGTDMRRWDGTGSGRNTAEYRQQTGRERVNEYFDVAIVQTGKHTFGSVLSEDEI